MRLDFAIIGAQKAATTTLAGALARHPQVAFCAKKEPHYFSKAKDPEAGLAVYARLFPGGEGLLRGEASTSYTFYPQYPQTAERLWRHNPHMRLIYLVRDPVDRMVSLYMHRLVMAKRNRPVLPFEDAVFADPAYVDRTRYAIQLEQYERYFPAEQILVLTFDQVVNRPAECWPRVGAHLGIDPPDDPVGAMKAANVTAKRERLRPFPGRRVVERVLRRAPQMRVLTPSFLYRRGDVRPHVSPEVRRRLWGLVAGDVDAVGERYGLDLSDWKEKHEPCTSSG